MRDPMPFQQWIAMWAWYVTEWMNTSSSCCYATTVEMLQPPVDRRHWDSLWCTTRITKKPTNTCTSTMRTTPFSSNIIVFDSCWVYCWTGYWHGCLHNTAIVNKAATKDAYCSAKTRREEIKTANARIANGTMFNTPILYWCFEHFQSMTIRSIQMSGQFS